MPHLAEHAWHAGAQVAAPILRQMLRRRIATGKEIAERLPERFGQASLPRPQGRLLWLHAASVGEMVSALPLLAALPDATHILFTTGTVTSARLLEERLAETDLAHRVIHQFVPLDVPAWAARFLDQWSPDAACFMESELWPNLLAACRQRRIPVALVNARLSARSASRWARVPALASRVLGQFAWISAQSAEDADRLARLAGHDVDAPGNLKLSAAELPANPEDVRRLAKAAGQAPRWLAASTHPQDDAWIADLHRTLAARHPGLITAVAPRHPDRGADIGPNRWSQGAEPAPGLWVADRLGQMGALYRTFPIVVMGKSFGPDRFSKVSHGGGQNPWEPAQLGCAILCGPAMQNFTEAVARLHDAGGLLTATDPVHLSDTLNSLLHEPARAAAMGAAARQATACHNALPQLLADRVAVLLEHG